MNEPDHAREDRPRIPDAVSSAFRSWRVVVRRRWPVATAAFLVLLLTALALSRRGPIAGEAGRADTAEGHGVDSVVTLDSTSLQLAGIELATVGTMSGGDLVANGTIAYHGDRVSVVAPRAEGRVVSVRADLGQRVAAGGTLAILSSPEVGQTQGEMERARVTLDVARQNYDREKRLYEQSISSQREMLEAEGAFRSAQAEYNSAAARLGALGAAPGDGGTFALVAPIAGTVVERNVMPGQIAGPETNLFTVADLRRLWITVDVYESDFGRVRQGAAASVHPQALPDQTFPGRVTYAGGIVDAASRTFKVRVEVDNRALQLRPGMFVQVHLETPAGASSAKSVVIPELAVQELNGKAVVFVRGAAPGQFAARPVTLGTRTGGGMIAVAAGLQPGERIVVKGAFQLKAELTKGSFGEDER